ncbi:baseplate J/gp47 family protein [Polymorphum gilvum]|uniref:Phage protein gp26 n=1 Tax=Polymorphum gilvum (strain LMG 25793 / CGMCC 1.9160 / SL003B-26A1) TaxID=991905 RepID=F2J637_POLGS|nr:baseplate J/gp47 family protein [Polymorphum gilvum]ADZ72401.1 Phage protein gp26 [Polymorphum gilvum SL003B-26A1]
MTRPDLPPPAILEDLDFEAILAAIAADAQTRLAAAGIAWDVGALETDPVTILCQAFAYRELLLRARINDAARSNLLAFAATSDLDHLAAFHDVTRLVGEGDDRLRDRVWLAILGRSAGGPLERYKTIALAASLQVRDVAIWRAGRDPTVHVAVLSTDTGGEASPALLAAVRSALEAPAVRVVSDRFEVISAIRTVTDVALTVRLAPDAPVSRLADVAATVREAWTAESLLGLDLTSSWLIAKAMVPGVTRVAVTWPTEDLVAAPNEAIGVGSIDILDGGRGR